MSPPSANSRTALVLAAVNRWNAGHPAPQQIDPQAELRVAGVEGLSGGIGDGGHAFGPNQLNDAGGVLTGKLSGLSPTQKNAWAWSPQGMDYALGGVAGAAGGQHGNQAIENIVRRFERPADPNGEVARALGGQTGSGFGGAYSRPGSAGAQGPAPSAPAPAAAPDNRRAFTLALMGAISPTGQLNNPAALVNALQRLR